MLSSVSVSAYLHNVSDEILIPIILLGRCVGVDIIQKRPDF